MRNFKIKRITEAAEIAAATKLAHDVFMEFEAPFYAPEGIKSFENLIFKPENLPAMLESEAAVMWGCYRKNALVGMMAVRDFSHVSLAFTKKEYHRMGAGTMLFAALRAYSLSKFCTEITVNSSPYGVPFYKSLGFTATDSERMDFGMIYIPMTCRIEN